MKQLRIIQRMKRVTAASLASLALALAALVPLVGPAGVAGATTIKTYDWSKRSGLQGQMTYGDVTNMAVAADSSGNTYSVGYFTGDVIFDGFGGSDTASSADLSAFITKRSSNGSYVWTKTVDGDSLYAYSRAFSVAVDSNDNVYVYGDYYGTVLFDGWDDRETELTNAFLLKYAANGSYIETLTSGPDDEYSYIQPRKVVVDYNDDLYLVGTFGGTVDHDIASPVENLNTSINGSSYLTKMLNDNSYEWTSIMGTANGGASTGEDVAVDGAGGNVIITGTTWGEVEFDGPSGTETHISNNGTPFVIKYGTGGSFSWGKTFGVDGTPEEGSAHGNGVAVDANHNVYITGGYNDTVTFDGAGGSDTRAASSPSVFVTKYDQDGYYQWTRSTYGGNGSQGNKIVSDHDGHVYVTGEFEYIVYFDGYGGSDDHNGGDGSAFVTELSEGGAYGWTHSFGVDEDGEAEALGLAVTPSSLYFVGMFSDGLVTFDGSGGSDDTDLTSYSGNAAFITKLGRTEE